MVSLGHHRSTPKATTAGDDFFIYMEEAYKMLNAVQ